MQYQYDMISCMRLMASSNASHVKEVKKAKDMMCQDR